MLEPLWHPSLVAQLLQVAVLYRLHLCAAPAAPSFQVRCQPVATACVVGAAGAAVGSNAAHSFTMQLYHTWPTPCRSQYAFMLQAMAASDEGCYVRWDDFCRDPFLLGDKCVTRPDCCRHFNLADQVLLVGGCS